MNETVPFTDTEQARKIDELLRNTRHWKSTLELVRDEILFIDRLLNSYAFEPDTPNLFERLQDYKQRLKIAKSKKTEVTWQISEHENNLGGMMECKNETCDLVFYEKHNILRAKVVEYVEGFQNLKGEIFNYAGGILKKRKPGA
ncbi:hypothetical protein ACEZ3G_04475 [Maribacter algicola]|uniref:Uncharacterized protein n=1 Tax=Meishania litoralis TaxID=3434685 RepID=A0ACC7LHP5_9FLAO